MIYLIGAIALCFISVRALNRSKKIYIENGSVVVSCIFALIGIVSVLFACEAVTEFIMYMGWN